MHDNTVNIRHIQKHRTAEDASSPPTPPPNALIAVHLSLQGEGDLFVTDLRDLTRVVRGSGEGQVVDAGGHVHHHLVLVHGDGGAVSLLQGQHNDCCVVGAKHALLPKQQRRAAEAAGTRHALGPLRSGSGSRRKRRFTARESHTSSSHY